MQVKILGFHLQLAKNISMGDFYQQLETIENKEIKIGQKVHVLLTDIVENLICGVILTFRNNKKSIATEKDENGDLVVNKSTLKAGEFGTEVSVFVLNPASNKGLLYSYSGSASPTSVQHLFRLQHNKIKSGKIREFTKELTDFGKKDKNSHKKAAKEFYGDLHFNILTTPSDLNELIPRYKEIQKVILRSENALQDSGKYTPLEHLTKKAHIQIDLERKTVTNEIVDIIKTIFSPFEAWKKNRTLRLIGLSHSGDYLDLAVGDNKDDFGKIDYDDYIDKLPLFKWKNYKECDALVDLLVILNDHPSVFGKTDLSPLKWKYLSAKDVNLETGA